MTKIYIDPGHGGKDPGALGYNSIGAQVQEKNIVLPLSQFTRRCLIGKGYNVMISRNEDKYVTLMERVNEANNWGADAFLCVHSNARQSGFVQGFEVETYWMKPNEREYARQIHNHFINGMEIGYLGILQIVDRGLKTENFCVLRETKMISALIEVGFVTDIDDVGWLADEMHQRMIGRILCEAMDKYLNPNE